MTLPDEDIKLLRTVASYNVGTLLVDRERADRLVTTGHLRRGEYAKSLYVITEGGRVEIARAEQLARHT